MSADLPEALTERFLRSIRNQFYKGKDRLFFQEKRLLLMSISYPASWLEDKGVRLSAERYTEILTTIIRTINAHGNLSSVRSMGRYLLHAVQQHMLHHGDEYYEIGKRTRNTLDDVMRGLLRQHQISQEAAAIQAGDSTVSDLAKVHKVLSSAKSGRKPGQKKLAETAMQGDLFAHASPLQSRRPRDSRGAKNSQTFEKTGVSPQKVLKSGAGDSICA